MELFGLVELFVLVELLGLVELFGLVEMFGLVEHAAWDLGSGTEFSILMGVGLY